MAPATTLTDFLQRRAVPGASSTATSVSSSSKSASASAAPTEPLNLLPPCPHLRKLLLGLSKPALINLVLDWINSANASVGAPAPSSSSHNDLDAPRIIAPLLSRSGTSPTRAASLHQLCLLYSARDALGDEKVSRTRVIDRILDVDYSAGLTWDMVAMVACRVAEEERSSRQWTAVAFDGVQKGDGAISSVAHIAPQTLQRLLSSELSHYFPSHHLYRHRPSKTTSHLCSFTLFRLVLPSTPQALCSPTALLLLHIPGTPFALLSGSMGKLGGRSAQRIVLDALGAAIGAKGWRSAIGTTGGFGARAGREREGEEQEEQEDEEELHLKARDPVALRDILLRGAEEDAASGAAGDGEAAKTATASAGDGGGVHRDLRRARAEDGPLVEGRKRRREDSEDVRLLYAQADRGEEVELLRREEREAEEALESLEVRVGEGLAKGGVKERKREVREEVLGRGEREREARELFGRKAGDAEDDAALEKVERIDYELYLPIPTASGYSPIVSATEHAPIKLRLQGSHVLKGLRKLVEAGMERSVPGATPETSAKSRAGGGKENDEGAQELGKGLPGWLTQVRGTRVVVGLEGRGARGKGGRGRGRGGSKAGRSSAPGLGAAASGAGEDV